MIANARVFTLASSSGLVVRLTNYGGILMSVLAPDGEGRLADVVLGYDSVDPYRANPGYLGAIIGRCANRIANARFSLAGTRYQLTANEGPHTLHGGATGFDRRTWDAEAGPDAAVLTYVSPAGEEGFPGTLSCKVTYMVTSANALSIEYEAVTDAATPVSLTQHSYFNLAGAGTVLDHRLELAADDMTPVDAAMIPTGEIVPVSGSFDFRVARALAPGLDRNYVLRGAPGTERLAARLSDPRSGRTLEIRTTEPCLQLYTGGFLNQPGRHGGWYGASAGVALETQRFPDAPNQPGFPPSTLFPGRTWRSRTVLQFGVT